MTTPEQLSVIAAKVEILDDIGAGRVPADVPDFSALHEYVDANEYGGLCSDFADFTIEAANEVQLEVDRWITSGGLRYDLATWADR